MEETITINGIDFWVEYDRTQATFSGGDIIGEGRIDATPDGGLSEGRWDFNSTASDNSREATHLLIAEIKDRMLKV